MFVPSGDNSNIHCDLTVSELFEAYYDCRRNKRNTWNALLFEQNLEKNLMDLYYELVGGSYTIGKSIMFVITRPKYREVWAADFRDRVVHHLFYNRYADYFYRRFIYDSYACIPGKGTLRASERLEYFLRSASKNYTEPTYFLKADIQNFFVTIDKVILDSILTKHITNPFWLKLVKQILHHRPQDNVYIKSNADLIATVPRHKSLLCAETNKGLPIGNLSSQFFANIYLNEMDQYIKHNLKCKYYLRYVDDIVILHNDPKHLNTVYEDIDNYTLTNLLINFHPNKKELNVIDKGVNFVGYIVKPYCKYIRRTTIDNAKKCASVEKPFEGMRPSMNSYLGFMQHANCFNERKNLYKLLGPKGYWFNGKLTKITRRSTKCTSA